MNVFVVTGDVQEILFLLQGHTYLEIHQVTNSGTFHRNATLMHDAQHLKG